MRSPFCMAALLTTGTISATFFAGKYHGSKGHMGYKNAESYWQIKSEQVPIKMSTLGLFLGSALLFSEIDAGVSLLILLACMSLPRPYEFGRYRGMLEYEEKQAFITTENKL